MNFWICVSLTAICCNLLFLIGRFSVNSNWSLPWADIWSKKELGIAENKHTLKIVAFPHPPRSKYHLLRPTPPFRLKWCFLALLIKKTSCFNNDISQVITREYGFCRCWHMENCTVFRSMFGKYIPISGKV